MSALDRWVHAGALSPLDARFAEAMVRLVDHPAKHLPLVRLAAALASRAVERGHVCADLERLSREPLLDADGVVVNAEPPFALGDALAALEASPLVCDGSVDTPLVLRQTRLYLHRYYMYERRLAEALRRRASSIDVDEAVLAGGLARLFAEASAEEQKQAARRAVESRLAVISGGPGTGKTTTVAKILALLVEQAEARGHRLRVQLVAPTGKAAQRLGESLDATVAKLDTSEAVRAAIPRRASTIHRALGYQPRTPTRFRFAHKNPMSVDVLLADEASMIDLALMTKLVEAVPRDARLILLGDKDQLASVDAGAVLSDIWEAEALAPFVSKLTRTFRFAERSGIAALARAIVAGDADRALDVLRGEDEMPYGEVALHDGVTAIAAELPSELAFSIRHELGPLLRARAPEDRLERLHAFRILCAHRRGPAGVLALNVAVERFLRAEGLVRADGDFYDGRPVIVTANDHQLGLYNGDIGVVCHEGGARRVYFAAEGGPRAIPLGRLPPHETVYAMTVHKSQGSEVGRVALMLPPAPSPLVTRELLYTAVTRARDHVDIFGTAEVLRHGMARRIERASGLTEALRG